MDLYLNQFKSVTLVHAVIKKTSFIYIFLFLVFSVSFAITWMFTCAFGTMILYTCEADVISITCNGFNTVKEHSS